MNTSGPPIEKGVPLPSSRNRGMSNTLRALASADIGDSVLFPDMWNSALVYLPAIRIWGTARWLTTKTTAEGVRVWKIEEPPPMRIKGYRS